LTDFLDSQYKIFEPILRAKHYLGGKIRPTDISQQQYKQHWFDSQQRNSSTTTRNIYLAEISARRQQAPGL